MFISLLLIFLINSHNCSVFNSLKQTFIKGEEISEELKEDIKFKLDNYSLTKSDKYFLQACLVLDENIDDSKILFNKSIENIEKNTKLTTKIYSNKFLSDFHLRKDDTSKALYHANKAFSYLDESDYSNEFETVWSIYRNLTTHSDLRDIVLNNIVHILDNSRNLSIEAEIFYNKKLSVLYILEHNYLRAIENNRRIIDLSEKIDSKYVSLKSTIDIAIISKELGAYDATIDILSNIDISVLNDELLEADLQVYKFLNLAQAEIQIKNFDKALDNLNELDKYSASFNSPKKKLLDDLTNILKSYIYAIKDDLDKANEYLDKLTLSTQDRIQSSYSNHYSTYNLLLGLINLKEGNIDESILHYEAVLMQDDECLTNNKSAIYGLISIYYKVLKDDEKAEYYADMLLGFEEDLNTVLSESFYKYIFYKEKYAVLDHTSAITKNLNIILFVLLILLTVFIIYKLIYPYITTALLKSKIKKYLVNDTYELHYQPLVSLDNKILGFESLIRLRINGNIIMPNVIIKDIMSCNMLTEVSLWILKKVTLDYKKLSTVKGISNDYYVSINVSINEIESYETCVKLCSILRDSGLHKNSICLEITENISPKNIENLKSNVTMLKSEGFLIAIDDFGVDYSNISILDKFYFDTLKLDKYFIDHIMDSNVVEGLISTICYLAHKERFTVVVEGVETIEQINYIKSLSSDRIYIQGYYYSKPLPLEDVIHINIPTL